jgi:biotin carboxyl carrier protein
MNNRPATESPSAGAELNVSIAGSPHETMTAALDDAMAKLNMVTNVIPPAESMVPPHAKGAPIVLSLIDAICRSKHRREALAELVDFLAAQSPDCNVRGGIGNDKLNRLYDPRLGWLGPESSLFDPLHQWWEQPLPESAPTNDATLTQHDDTAVLSMNQTDGAGRCMVWIEGIGDQHGRLSWLERSATTINSAFWSRPGKSLPNFVVRLAQRSSITIGIISLLIIVAAVWPVQYRVACQTRVETTAQRLIATPFEATLKQSNFKPGDVVKAGEILLVLDGRPLRLEREAIEAERQQVAKEHDAALATGRIADSQQAALKNKQLARRSELLDDRLQNLDVVSPIDGVVVSGDLKRYVGSPLERGQTLMEIAPMDQMVIEVEIPEHEIGYVQKGAETRIKIDAIGGESMQLVIDDLYPRAELRDERNVFIAKINVENADGKLKPGMLGQATTYGPLRPWIWSWVRGGFEQVLWWIGY